MIASWEPLGGKRDTESGHLHSAVDIAALPLEDLRGHVTALAGVVVRAGMSTRDRPSGEAAISNQRRPPLPSRELRSEPPDLDLPRFRRHLDASGHEPGRVRFGVPTTRPPYPEEFRREADRLAQLGDRPQRRLAPGSWMYYLSVCYPDGAGLTTNVTVIAPA